MERSSYPLSINLLALRHLGLLSLSHTKREALIIPALNPKLIQNLLLLTARYHAILPATSARFNRLDQRSVVTFQPVAFQIIFMLNIGKLERAEFGIGPAGPFERV